MGNPSRYKNARVFSFENFLIVYQLKNEFLIIRTFKDARKDESNTEK